MPTRPKPIALIKAEGNKRHLTKAEIELREKAEKELLTGVSLKEWPDVKANPIAHKEFIRLKKLLKAINKDDALHEGVINRYCLLLAECKQFESMKAQMFDEIKQMAEMLAAGKIDELTFIQEKGNIQDRIMACDKKIMEKRKMMLDIEKENIMTIASALRSIPKKPDKSTEKSPMAAFLERRQAGNNVT